MAKRKTLPAKRSPKSTKAETDRRISLTYEFLKDGKTRGHIVDYFLNAFPTLSKISVDKYIARAKLLIANDIERDANYLVALHTSRYDDIYETDKDAANGWIESPSEAWEYAQNAHIVRRYQSVLQAMKQKEDVYMLHTPDAKAALRKLIDPTSKNEGKPVSLNYEFDKLELPQLIKMKSLMDKMRVIQEDTDNYIVEDDSGEFSYQEESTLAKDGGLLHSKVVVVEGIDQIKTLEAPEGVQEGRVTSSIKVVGSVEKGKKPEDVVAKMKAAMKADIAKKYGKKTDKEKAKEELKKQIVLSIKKKSK